MLTLGQLVAVEHRERLAAVPEPAIFALNHRNRLEALLAPTVLIYLRRGAPLHFLADWMFVEAPGLGWLLRQSEPVAVYGKPALWKWRDGYRRERLRRPALDACLDWLERGESVGIFPEGTRNRDAGRLLRGRPGLGELALRSGAPVVPVAIKYPPQRPTCMVLAIGEPLDFAAERRELAATPAATLAAAAGRGTRCPPPQPRSPALRDLSRRVVDRVMAALAAELGKDYAVRPRPAGRAGGSRGHRSAPERPAAPAPNRRSEAT
jgi:1-acyl-sn-glycerol-3-phosphate acyltransferase